MTSFAPSPIHALLDALLPRFCLACEERLTGERDSAAELGLCRRCATRLRRVDRRPACRTCALPLGEATGPRSTRDGFCGVCALAPPPHASLFALWQYEPPLRELVHGFKFQRLDYLGKPLGRRLGRALAERACTSALVRQPFDCLVPLPLSWTRRLLRGYNQCDELARAAARELALPVRRLLSRQFGPGAQTGRRRLERLRTSGFRLAPFRRLSGERLLLLDDVYTTGATVRAASRALLAAGASRVDVAVVAWTAPGGFCSRENGPVSGRPEGD